MRDKKLLKISIKKAAIIIILLLTAIIVLFVAIKLNHKLPKSPETRNMISIKILTSLKQSIRNENAADKMQEIFPEGACFTLTLYGLSWANLAVLSDIGDEIKENALIEILWTIKQYDEKYVVQYFEDTEVRNGVFWLGQKNLLLGKFIETTNCENKYPDIVNEFHENSNMLFDQFMKNPTRHLNSYKNLCWPADNVTALLSLSIHDKLYKTTYMKAYEEWKVWTINNPDPQTGLPAGQLNNTTGELLQTSRGCANSWIISLLAEMDSEYSKELYLKYKQYFLIERLGIKMFREYPKGVDNPADVDSGPIIWGAGVAASGLGIGAALKNNDYETANDLVKLLNIFSFENNKDSGREYFFGKLPIADAFIAWQFRLNNSDKIIQTKE
jgi:hypothetical protein